MYILRHYQQRIKQKVYALYKKGTKNVLVVKPTGMGKTVLFCSIAQDMAVFGIDLFGTGKPEKYPTAITVHREELLGQISLTLAKEGIVHNIVAPPTTIANIIKAHRNELGKSYYSSQSIISVVSVDTFNSRYEKAYMEWVQTIRFWICDEAAHVLAENKWGKCLSKFTNAIGLGVTATPQRLDGKGLGTPNFGGRGLFEAMVEGPSTYWGIKEGFLSDFTVAIPESDYINHLGEAKDGKDFTPEQMKYASSKSTITGDVVRDYLKYANGKQAILFAATTDDAREMVHKFHEAGVTAELLTATSLKSVRYGGLQRFKNKETKVLLNIDLFDEGLDIAGIEVVIMARPTASLGKVLQMYGRGLRPFYAKGFDLFTKEGRLAAQAASPKQKCILIDHVGNIRRHGPPNVHRFWSLAGANRKKQKTTRDCWNVPDCGLPFPKAFLNCPHCGKPAIDPSVIVKGGGRVSPQMVDGDLRLIDSETLKKLYEAALPKNPADVGKYISSKFGRAAGLKAMADQEIKNQTAQQLADRIAAWTGELELNGYDIDMVHKEFYSQFEMTINESLALSKKDMEKIMGDLI